MADQTLDVGIFDHATGTHWPIKFVVNGDGSLSPYIAGVLSGGTTTTAGNVYAPGSLPTLAGTAQPISVDANGVVYTHDRQLSATSAQPDTVQVAQGANLLAVDTSGRIGVHTNVSRTAGTTHRSAIVAADKLAVPGTLTVTLQTGGSLTVSTTYFTAISAYNKYGPTGPGALPAGVATTSGNLTLRIAFAQVAGADGYDVFLGTVSGAPLWVARITEAQRAAGALVTAVGTVTTGSIAGAVDVQVAGTGVGSNGAPFTANNAYTPDSLTDISCVGYSLAHIKVAVAVTDLRSQPTLTLVPFLKNQIDGFHDQAQVITVTLAGASGPCLRQDYVLQLDGATGLVVAIGTISGNGTAVTITVELA